MAGWLEISIIQALTGETLIIYVDGLQSRSFCFVDDLIDGIVALMDSEPGFTGPVNLGSPVEFPMRELAQMVIDRTGSKSDLVEETLPADDPRQRQPDIGHARRRLGWEPKVALRAGPERTIQDLRERIHA